MKGLLGRYIFQLLGLWMCRELFGDAFVIYGGIRSYLIGGAVLALLNLLLKPILKLLFLPINAATLGLFSLIINAGVFFIFMKLVSGVSLSSWFFPGFTISMYHIPSQQFEFWGTLVVISATLSLITSFLLFLVK